MRLPCSFPARTGFSLRIARRDPWCWSLAKRVHTNGNATCAKGFIPGADDRKHKPFKISEANWKLGLMQTHEIKAAQKYRSAWSCRAISVEDGARMYALSAEGPTTGTLIALLRPILQGELEEKAESRTP